MYNKREKDFVEKVEGIISTMQDEEQKKVITELLRKYENATYQEWDERHKFYEDVVDNMVNDTLFQDDKLAQTMANNHPTLQQSFMRFVMKFIKRMSEKTYFDGRNENSVKLAKKIMESVKDDICLPCI